MSVAENSRPAGLVARVTNILLRPKAEWGVVAAESPTLGELFLGYAAVLAAIPALARLADGLLPRCLFGVCVNSNPVFVAVSAVVYYALSLAGVFVIGLIIDALAPSFGGERNQIQAMKLAVYSNTAAWLAGVFILVPFLGIPLMLLGLYSLYLLYVGLPTLMKSPPDKAPLYTVVVVAAAIVVFIVGGAIAASVASLGMLAGINAAPTTMSGTLHVGGASVDLGRLQAAAQQAEAAAKQAQESGAPSGQAAAVDPEKLKALLPDSIAGAPRTETAATSAGTAGGLGGSNASATYEADGKHVTLTITDLAAAGGLAAMAGAVNIQEDKQTATGYEKAGNVDGHWTVERYDTQEKSGEYSTIVGNRFAVSAEGSGIGMDDLKAAVAAIGADRLQALAHG